MSRLFTVHEYYRFVAVEDVAQTTQPTLTLSTTQAPTIRCRVTERCRLPGDLMQRIIPLTVEGCIGDLDPAKPPLLLRNVSTYWEAVADSIPKIWSRLIITPPCILFQNLSRLRGWIERADNNIELLVIHAPPPIPIAYIRLLREIIYTLLPTASRWRYLELHVPDRFLRTILGDPYVRLSSLEGLKLITATNPTFTMYFPPLRHFSMTVQHNLVPIGVRDGLFWRRLVILDLTTIRGTLGLLWNLLGKCSQLRRLSITAFNNDTIPRIPYNSRNPLRSNLQHLLVRVNTRAAVIGLFLDGLFLPCLQDMRLYFANTDDEDVWPSQAIVGLRTRCLPPLRQLLVVGKYMNETHLIEFVQEIKTLERLVATRGPDDFVTPAIRELLPQTESAVRQQRLAYDVERYYAVLEGRL